MPRHLSSCHRAWTGGVIYAQNEVHGQQENEILAVRGMPMGFVSPCRGCVHHKFPSWSAARQAGMLPVQILGCCPSEPFGSKQGRSIPQQQVVDPQELQNQKHDQTRNETYEALHSAQGAPVPAARRRSIVSQWASVGFATSRA